MSKDLIIALLSLAFAGCAGALLVTIAKLDEQKRIVRDEHANYVAARGLHNTVCAFADKQGAEIEELEQNLRDAQGTICLMESNVERLVNERDALRQDLKSALLCPRQDHVWKDGVCVKCGRLKDATD